MYASTIKLVIPEGINIYGYADDHALMNSYPVNDKLQEKIALSTLEKTLIEVN
jgi:hypothetical protein